MRSTYSDYNKVCILLIIYPQPEKKKKKTVWKKRILLKKEGKSSTFRFAGNQHNTIIAF